MRYAMFCLSLLVSLSSISSAQNAKTDSVVVHMVNDSTGAIVFTDYGNCRVITRHGLEQESLNGFGVEIIAVKGDTIQHLRMRGTILPNAVNGIKIENLAQKFDPTRGPDLVNRQCAGMLQGIQVPSVRDFVLKVLVK
jgi:hypothetical protein